MRRLSQAMSLFSGFAVLSAVYFQALAEEPLSCSKANYYADFLAGNETASGEKYDPSKLTAAHASLPFGTKLKVVREGYGQILVTVNDRAVFEGSIGIELSRAAAEALDMIDKDGVEVCLFSAE